METMKILNLEALVATKTEDVATLVVQKRA
jgi:hypothetical protein